MDTLNYKYLETVALIFWDEPGSYKKNETEDKIAPDLFKSIAVINSRAEFDSAISSYQDPNQLVLVLVHLDHSNANRGNLRFKSSGILRKYPNLRYYLISSFPKRKIHADGKDHLDVFSYDEYQEKIGSALVPQSKLEIQSNDTPEGIIPSKAGIFLSHSSDDREIVKKFRDIVLESGLGCNPTQIKFTSEEDHGIPGGINIPADLKDFLLNQTGLFIQFISPSYEKSRVCLNEEGAGWCLIDDLMFVTILLDSSTSKNISWVKSLNKAIKLDNKGALLNLYENRKSYFNNVDSTRLNAKIDEFIREL